MNYVSQENLDRIVIEMAKSVGSGTGNGLEDWQAEHEYKEKDICVYEGQIYRAKVGYTSDTTFSTTQILQEYTPVGGETIIPYEKDTAITTGDIVSYDGNDYEALYDFVCGEEFSLYALEEYVPIELTDDDIKEIVGAYNPVVEEAKGVEYSTEERRIGTWIDGKPLYQKTYNVITPSTVDTFEKVVNFSDNTVDIKNMEGYFIQNNNPHHIPINIYTGTSYMACFEVFDLDSYGIAMKTNVNHYLSRPCYITTQYTKTTD